MRTGDNKVCVKMSCKDFEKSLTMFATSSRTPMLRFSKRAYFTSMTNMVMWLKFDIHQWLLPIGSEVAVTLHKNKMDKYISGLYLGSLIRQPLDSMPLHI